MNSCDFCATNSVLCTRVLDPKGPALVNFGWNQFNLKLTTSSCGPWRPCAPADLRVSLIPWDLSEARISRFRSRDQWNHSHDGHMRGASEVRIAISIAIRMPCVSQIVIYNLARYVADIMWYDPTWLKRDACKRVIRRQSTMNMAIATMFIFAHCNAWCFKQLHMH